MNLLKQYWAHIPAWAYVVVQFLSPSLVAYEQAHPKSTVTVLIGVALMFFHSTAPKDAGLVKQP